MDEIRKINVYISKEAKALLIQYQRDNDFPRQDDALDELIKDWNKMNNNQTKGDKA